MTSTLATLLTRATRTEIYAKALEIADLVGVPTTSWEPGNPTRSSYHVLSWMLDALEQVAQRYVASGFLSFAAQLEDTQWIKLLAYEVYGYTAREATNATCTMLLTNNGGGEYTIDPGDLTFRRGDETYRNTTGGLLAIGPTTTLEVEVECEIAGSSGSAAIGEITELVTSLLGVVCENTTAAVGLDEETVESIAANARARISRLSDMGPADAYRSVALDSTLTGTTNVTRVRVDGDSLTGEVTVTLASSSGGVTTDDIDDVTAAIAEHAAPLCITPIVQTATVFPVNITATVNVYSEVNATEAEIQTGITTALNTMFATTPIGGDEGALSRAKIISTIRNAYSDHIYDVTLSVPAANVPLTSTQVATPGAISITAVIV